MLNYTKTIYIFFYLSKHFFNTHLSNYMPQLDLMTFFTQFFWFCLSFIVFYLLLLHYILPFLVLNLKFRKEMLKVLAYDINKKKENVSDIYGIYDNIIFTVLTFFRSYISKILKFSNLWIISNLVKVNLGLFLQVNTKLLKAVIEKKFIIYIINNKLIKVLNKQNLSRNLKYDL